MADHPIVHVEIPTNNSKESSEFYSKVFGWQITTAPEYDYWMFRPDSGPGGGFIGIDGMAQAKVNEPLIYIGTDDIEDSLRQIEEAGGKTVMGKTEIPGQGWFAVFTDTTGNKMALYTAMNPQQ